MQALICLKRFFPLDEDYGLVHLAGEPIFSWPWTRAKKEKIRSSRVEGAKRLILTSKDMVRSPQFFLSASAVGIYGEQGDRQMTETSPFTFSQDLFLQKVCQGWEEETLKAKSLCRTLIFRLGLVMSYKKGFLYEQEKWLKRGFLPFVINFKPCWISWISLEDLSRMLLWAIENSKAEGIYNAVSPHSVSLKYFYQSLSQKSRRKSIKVPFPLFLVRKLGGEMVKNLLTSCKVSPEKALTQGFIFKHLKIEDVI